MENKRKPWFYWMLFLATAIIVFLLGMLASSITNRRAEKEYVYKPMVEIKQGEPRNEEWGKTFPANTNPIYKPSIQVSAVNTMEMRSSICWRSIPGW